MKSDYIERRIRLNRNTSVVLRSKKDKDADIYRSTITVVHEIADTKPLQIGTRAELEAAIKEIDLDEDQLSLMAGERG